MRYCDVDFTGLEQFNITAGEMKQVAQACLGTSRRTPGGVVAIVAPRDDVFGMTRMWEALMDGGGWHMHVFRPREPALEWLVEHVGPVALGGAEQT